MLDTSRANLSSLRPVDEPQSNLYRMAKAAVGGDMAAYLTERRAEGMSFERIARDIGTRGVEVTGSIVAIWTGRLCAPAQDGAAS
jgi:hypothetical protein